MPPTIRVILADDHPLILTGLRTTLTAQADIELIGEATTGEEVQQLCLALRPDVLLLDLRMPGPPGLKTLAFLREHCATIKIIVLTAYDDDIYIRGVARAGAAGYILKDEAPEAVVQAIHTTVQGGTWFSRPVVDKLADLRKAEPHLTERERQILSLIVQGWDNARIAAEVGLAEQTIRNHASHLYAKLGVKSRTEAVIWAKNRGWEG
ncbi:MAG: DNA-binding response regulator [Anaerolineae bacterium]|jgi:DNA-binding NarL/FixJ family response regulator|nr:response regulator transcription factor [Anaerolineales bacterium]MCQ3972370.1 DNA-binding response regulator [Anaerolineae bacterium]